MANYPAASAETDFDTLAHIYDLLDVVLGNGTESGTASMGAQHIWDRVIEAADGPDKHSVIANLAGAAKTLAEKLKTASGETGYGYTVADLVGGFLRGLQTELDGNIDTWLTNNARRVHWNIQALHYQVFGGYLTPANVFPPVVEMGRVDRAAGEWAFTDGDEIDPETDNHGPGQLEIFVPQGYTIGAQDCVLTLTCVKATGSSEQRQVTMPAYSEAGTAVDVGTTSDVYTDVSAVSVTGGTDGDRVGVRTKLLRDITDTCD